MEYFLIVHRINNFIYAVTLRKSGRTGVNYMIKLILPASII